MKQITHYLKKAQSLLLAAVMLLSIGLSVVPHTVAAAPTPTNVPKVSFTFDDGLGSALTYGAPTLAAHGLTGTDYVITGCVGMTTTPNTCNADTTKSYMTWDQIAALHAAGWEIGSHTVTHPQLAVTDGAKDGSLPGGAAQVVTELTQSQQALKDHGYSASDFAFPYGDYDNNALTQAAKYYESARGFADLGYNTWPYDSSLVVNQQVQEGAAVGDIKGVTFAQVQAYIDAAITNNQWLVLTFHNISPTTPTSADDYTTSTALLDQIAAYVQQQQTAGKIHAVNVTDGLVRGTNMLANGDFTDGIADGWTTDSASITADANNNGRYPDPTHSVSLKNTAATDGHLFSPKVNVTFGKNYVLKDYVNMVAGGSVNFAIDEYDANGTWISWKDPSAGRAFATGADAINVGDTSFSYTPSSANVASASLQVIVRGTTTQAYLDGSEWYDVDALSNPVVTPPADTTAPVVSGVTVSSTDTTATISWTTDEASTDTVNYGTTTAYGQTATDSATGTTHSVTLTGLTASTNYSYQIVAKDAAGNTSDITTGIFGTIATTTTPGAILGDLDGNGVVNGIDLSTLLANWNTTIPYITPTLGDLDGNGLVNGIDLSTLLGNWSIQ